MKNCVVTLSSGLLCPLNTNCLGSLPVSFQAWAHVRSCAHVICGETSLVQLLLPFQVRAWRRWCRGAANSCSSLSFPCRVLEKDRRQCSH